MGEQCLLSSPLDTSQACYIIKIWIYTFYVYVSKCFVLHGKQNINFPESCTKLEACTILWRWWWGCCSICSTWCIALIGNFWLCWHQGHFITAIWESLNRGSTWGMYGNHPTVEIGCLSCYHTKKCLFDTPFVLNEYIKCSECVYSRQLQKLECQADIFWVW